MSFINKLFGKKKKPKNATCDISKEPIEEGFGYLLTTSEVVSSRKFWDNVMTEPETMSYTISHFKNQDNTATQMRSMIFDKHSTIEKPWMVSDSYIHLFEVDKSEARAKANEWWSNEGNVELPNSGTASDMLDDQAYEEIKKYAIMEAGKERVA